MSVFFSISRSPLRATVGLAAAVVLAGFAAGCGSGSSGGGQPSTSPSSSSLGSIKVAAAGFTESDVLAYMYADLLDNAGFSASVTQVEDSEISEKSLEQGSIAVEPNYAATYANELDTEVTGSQTPTAGTPSLSNTIANLKKYGQKVGVEPLDPSKAVDQNAFAVTKTYATEHHLTTLSDLGASHLPVTLAAPQECSTRPYCEPGLKRVYGINIVKLNNFDFDSTAGKKAVEDGDDTMVEVGTTDDTLSTFNLVLLADNKHLQNADYLTPIANISDVQAHPQIATALNPLSKVLTTSDLEQLDNEVDNERQLPQDAAKAFLQQHGLLS